MKDVRSFLKKSHYLCLGIIPLLVACRPTPEYFAVPLKSDIEECDKNTVFGFPQEKASDERIAFFCKDNYVAGFDLNKGVSRWVVEKISGEDIVKNYKEPLWEDYFRGDAGLKKEDKITADEIKELLQERELWRFSNKSNWKGNEKGMSSTDSSLNFYPMVKENVQLEKNIEKLIHQLAVKHKNIYVFSGAFYLNKSEKGAKFKTYGEVKKDPHKYFKIAEPTHIYRVIYMPSEKDNLVLIYPNTPVTSFHPLVYRTTLAQLEDATKLSFYPTLRKDLKQRLLTSIPTKL